MSRKRRKDKKRRFYPYAWNPPTPPPAPVRMGTGRLEKTLLVETDFFSAVATFRRIYGVWSCVDADSVLSWMKHTTMDQIKIALLKMGAQFQWLSPNQSGETRLGRQTASRSDCDGALQIIPRNSAGMTPLPP